MHGAKQSSLGRGNPPLKSSIKTAKRLGCRVTEPMRCGHYLISHALVPGAIQVHSNAVDTPNVLVKYIALVERAVENWRYLLSLVKGPNEL